MILKQINSYLRKDLFWKELKKRSFYKTVACRNAGFLFLRKLPAYGISYEESTIGVRMFPWGVECGSDGVMDRDMLRTRSCAHTIHSSPTITIVLCKISV